MNELVLLTIGNNSFPATLLVLKFARLCALSDSSFGNLIRYYNIVDIDVLDALSIVLERNGKTKPLELDELATLNLIAACDIVRKMFACDAIDKITASENIKSLDKITTGNLISYSNTLIGSLKNQTSFKKEIQSLLIKLDKHIQP